MSKFSTTIPVNVEAVTDSLPKNSFIHGVRIGDDKKSIVIDWEQDDWRTPYTVPVEVSPDALTGKEPLPETVKCKRVQNDDVAPSAPRKAKKTQ
jgi:hypothetical protein